MTPDAKSHDLMYASSLGTDDVYVYTYPKGKLVGTLTGFGGPQGMCVDAKGDVFIVDNANSDIVEYAHGGKKPIATLSDAGYYPWDCSVDATTGNLAVANIYSASGPGDIAIYANAQGSPTSYSDPSLAYIYFCGYDNAGNLYLDGLYAGNYSFAFAELPVGSAAFTNIPVTQSFEQPGGVQWDGKYVAVGDEEAGVIYQIDGTGGTVEGSTTLSGAEQVYQFWIPTAKKGKKENQASKVLAPSQDNNEAGIWKYPAGGLPIKTVTDQYAFGVTLSRVK